MSLPPTLHPRLPDLNLSNVPRDHSGCSDRGSRRPRNPSLCLGLVTNLRLGLCPQSRASLSLEVLREAAVAKEQSLSWGQPDCLRPTSLRSLWSLPLPIGTGLGAAGGMLLQRLLPSLEHGRRAAWCCAKSDNLSLNVRSLGLSPTPRKVLLKTSVQGRDLSFHSQPPLATPLTVPCTKQVLSRCSRVCRQAGDLGSAPGDTHGVDLERSQENGVLFPQVAVMFTPPSP